MAEKDFSPLSSACFRALTDKIYDKRKAAALEVEKMVRDFSLGGNEAGIKKLLVVLGKDLALSQNPNWRKGGLIGLAAMAVALQKNLRNYIQELVPPIVTALVDPDTRVKYYATESLYNVLTVAREDSLILFNEIFDVMSKLSAESDSNIQRGVEHIDSLMKNIVTECKTFDLEAFMPLLRERIYTPKAQTRQFMISWIQLMQNNNSDMIHYLPEILDGLFVILSEPKLEIRQMCESLLSEFKGQIIANPSQADLASMVNILINHSTSPEPWVQFTAITWLKEFVNLKTSLLPYSAGLLTAILPCLDYRSSYDDPPKESYVNIIEVAKALNHSLMQMITDERNLVNDGVSSTTSPLESNDVTVDLSSVVKVLNNELKSRGDRKEQKTATKIAVLKWIRHLYIKLPAKIYPHLEELFPQLLSTLNDPSEEVILLLIDVFSQIFSTNVDTSSPYQSQAISPSSRNQVVVNNEYFNKFITELLILFKSNHNQLILNERGSFIIRQLCLQVNCQDVYKSLSESLVNHEDANFSYQMVQHLNRILFTSSETFELRNQLKDLQTDETCSLFVTLYKTWCYSPVASISLCLLTKNYEHAHNLTLLCGDLDITSEFLVEVDQLIQLIESPIFAFLRLQLLDVERQAYLIRTMYGLLMLLPQGSAFDILSKRLACVPNPQHSIAVKNSTNSSSQPKMDFKELLRHFLEIQDKLTKFKRKIALNRFNDS